MRTKTHKHAFLTLIGAILLTSFITIGCNNEKKKPDTTPATDTKTVTPPKTDTIPVEDTGNGKELDPPKRPGGTN
jgi:hypothetical protein